MTILTTSPQQAMSRGERNDIMEVSFIPVISTSIYAANDQIGGLIQLSNVVGFPGRAVALRGYSILSNTVQTYTFSVLFFNEQPAVTSVDNGAMDVPDAEMLKFVGSTLTTAAATISLANSSISFLPPTNAPVVLMSGTTRDLWCLMRVASGTPTFLATNDVRVKLYFQKL
jgi:hypothetical protein